MYYLLGYYIYFFNLIKSIFSVQEVQKDLKTKGEGIAEAIRSVEDFLAERGEGLSPEERQNLQGALTRMKKQYSALTDTANTSLSELDTAISTTVQQNTQRVRRSDGYTSMSHMFQIEVNMSF